MIFFAHSSIWRRAAHRLVAVVALVWAVAALAPCVMAAPMSAHDCCPDHAAAADMAAQCGMAALDCQLPDETGPAALAPDVPAYGAVLVTRLAVAEAPAAATIVHDRPERARPASRPPPYLEFTVLLI